MDEWGGEGRAGRVKRTEDVRFRGAVVAVAFLGSGVEGCRRVHAWDLRMGEGNGCLCVCCGRGELKGNG